MSTPPRMHNKAKYERVGHGVGGRRAPGRSSLYRWAAEFNEAFDTVFCKHRPWLRHDKTGMVFGKTERRAAA